MYIRVWEAAKRPTSPLYNFKQFVTSSKHLKQCDYDQRPDETGTNGKGKHFSLRMHTIERAGQVVEVLCPRCRRDIEHVPSAAGEHRMVIVFNCETSEISETSSQIHEGIKFWPVTGSRCRCNPSEPGPKKSPCSGLRIPQLGQGTMPRL
jgi:hypothetical protein